MSNFHAAASSRQFNLNVIEAVEHFSAKCCIDLNSVKYHSEDVLIIGEAKTGKQIFVRKTPKSWLVEVFDDGDCILSRQFFDVSLSADNYIVSTLNMELDALYRRQNDVTSWAKSNNKDVRYIGEYKRLYDEIAKVRKALRAMGQKPDQYE